MKPLSLRTRKINGQIQILGSALAWRTLAGPEIPKASIRGMARAALVGLTVRLGVTLSRIGGCL
jgi:hypothetical protein